MAKTEDTAATEPVTGIEALSEEAQAEIAEAQAAEEAKPFAEILKASKDPASMAAAIKAWVRKELHLTVPNHANSADVREELNP